MSELGNQEFIEGELEKQEETIKSLKVIVSGALSKEALDVWEKISNFTDKLIEDFGGRQKVEKYKLFHILIGSGYEGIEEKPPYFDVPGSLIEKFIREELGEKMNDKIDISKTSE